MSTPFLAERLARTIKTSFPGYVVASTGLVGSRLTRRNRSVTFSHAPTATPSMLLHELGPDGVVVGASDRVVIDSDDAMGFALEQAWNWLRSLPVDGIEVRP